MFRRSLSRFAPQIAVVLAGCGVYDGAECTESVATLIHLSAHKVPYTCFAPFDKQGHVINHQEGAEVKDVTRYIHEESARITRGPVKDVKEATAGVKDFSALVFPGGFGCMKNLSNFAFKGNDGDVRPDIAELILAFYKEKKPIGFSCISPMLGARVLGKERNGGQGVTLTLGATGTDFCKMAESWGNTVQAAGPTDITVDKEQKIVCTPAYMYDTSNPHDIYVGIGKFIDEILKMAQ